jgi:cell wall assembly regulator SMI1
MSKDPFRGAVNDRSTDGVSRFAAPYRPAPGPTAPGDFPIYRATRPSSRTSDALTADQLDELAARWRALDAPIAHSLEPGLFKQVIDEFGQSVGLWMPPEARTLWGWRNGANLKFIVDDGGHSFRSLQHPIEWVETMRRIAEEVADSYGPRADKAKIARDIWNWDWLPLCSDGTGGMLVIDGGVATRPSPTSPVA